MKYIIEHMESGFSEWVTLEYAQIIRDIGHENLILSSLPKNTTQDDIPELLRNMKLRWTTEPLVNIHTVFPDLEPLVKGRVCLLDPRAPEDLAPADATKFDYFVFGGILGDHPPRDRTSELMRNYPNLMINKRLGDKQMTTDTAIRTTQQIVEKQLKFSDIKFIDYPEFRFSKNEATEMPFRYILDSAGKPILPEGMLELIKKDSEQTLDDLF
ncbi:HHL249Wp [Eremothecium sinecaudum]|uniref:HHL249Wp n=1 Tax=Eremothecium sinecaudum TaxID=45286 RepID=A0A0X8HW02_9SACH|nr:HHL249Wp [Eremothecium sinecaudum]AMD22521.1 HHL249Wp [Eremothecium sinecaudum]